MKTTTKIILASAAALFLFANTTTRAAIMWLLPLGSGWDDVIFVGAAIVLVIALALRGSFSMPRWWRALRREGRDANKELLDDIGREYRLRRKP